MNKEGMLPCPCCGYYTADGPEYGSYGICQICGWEDDESQFRHPTMTGANRVTLLEARKNFDLHGNWEGPDGPAREMPCPHDGPRFNWETGEHYPLNGPGPDRVVWVFVAESHEPAAPASIWTSWSAGKEWAESRGVAGTLHAYVLDEPAYDSCRRVKHPAALAIDPASLDALRFHRSMDQIFVDIRR